MCMDCGGGGGGLQLQSLSIAGHLSAAFSPSIFAVNGILCLSPPESSFV